MAPSKHGFWRVCRVYFRRFRITVWLVILGLVSTLVYLNQVGLPGFAKQPLLDKLRQRGVNLQFSRIRLRWYEGIVADNVIFARAGEPLSPQVTVQEVQVLFSLQALAHFQIQVDSLLLRNGRLVWPIAETNQAPRDLLVDHIETKLRFLPGDRWALDQFKAAFGGARIQLSGVVTNASAIRQWRFVRSQPSSKTSTAAWQTRLGNFADTLKRVHFSKAPDLAVVVRGDARDLQSFEASVLVAAPDAETPWGTLTGGRVSARLFPASTNGLSRVELRVEAARSQTPWAALTNLALQLHLVSDLEGTNLVNCALALSAERVRTEWAGATQVGLTAHWLHSMTNPVPLSGQGELRCADAQTQWGTAQQISLKLKLSPPPPGAILDEAPDPSWTWWPNARSHAVDWKLHVGGLQTPKIQTTALDCDGDWRPPALNIAELQAALFGGNLRAHAGLDVATRALRLELASTFDPHKLEPILPGAGRRWLGQFDWTEPPSVQGQLAVVLPAWTNRQPDWRTEVLPSLLLSGQFQALRGGVYQKKLRVTSAQSHFVYSNMTWHLPDLALSRPEGGLLAEHRANERTKDFYWRLTSAVDLDCVRPFLTEEQQKAFDLLVWTQPPSVEAEVWGRYDQPGSLGIRGRVAATNFTFRGESIRGLQAALQVHQPNPAMFGAPHPMRQRGRKRGRSDRGFPRPFGLSHQRRQHRRPGGNHACHWSANRQSRRALSFFASAFSPGARGDSVEWRGGRRFAV